MLVEHHVVDFTVAEQGFDERNRDSVIGSYQLDQCFSLSDRIIGFAEAQGKSKFTVLDNVQVIRN